MENTDRANKGGVNGVNGPGDYSSITWFDQVHGQTRGCARSGDKSLVSELSAQRALHPYNNLPLLL